MASRSYSGGSSTDSTHTLTHPTGTHRTSDPLEESEPFEESASQTPVHPSFSMNHTTGPRTRQTARKRVGRYPTGPLGRSNAELARSRSYHVGGPSSPVPIDPAENARRRASIDLSAQGQIWTILRSHRAQLQHFSQTERETYMTIQQAEEYIERHDREISQLQAEIKMMKNKKGFFGRAWDWIRGRP